MIMESSGGGGGSYNAGINQSNASAANAGPGYVTITFIPPGAAQMLASPAALTAADMAFLEAFSSGPDADLDGFPDAEDNCPLVFNSDQVDADLDAFGDACDNCVLDPNPQQADADLDGYGNRCDADLNNDGAVGLDDVTQILSALNSNALPAADLNGDGGIGMDDVSEALGRVNSLPGPSGLACAGQAPCGSEGM